MIHMLPHVGFVARHSSVHSSFHVTKDTSDQLIMIDSLNLVIFDKWSTLLNGLYLWQWSTTQQYSTLDLHVDTTTTTQRSCTPRTVHKWLAQLHCQTGWGSVTLGQSTASMWCSHPHINSHKTCSETSRLLFFLFFTSTGTVFRHHFTQGIVLEFSPLFQQNSIFNF